MKRKVSILVCISLLILAVFGIMYATQKEESEKQRVDSTSDVKKEISVSEDDAKETEDLEDSDVTEGGEVTEETKTTEEETSPEDLKWEYEEKVKETVGAFTYVAYPSKDGEEVWVYKIKINEKKDYSVLEIPKVIDGKKVTRLGAKDGGDEAGLTIFNCWVETFHNADGWSETVENIKEITLPETVEIIQPVSFSGMNSITEFVVPEKVTVIDYDVFYGCDNLKTLELPAGLEEFDVSAVVDCPSLTNVSISSENEKYRVENNCLITKENEALIYVFSNEDVFEIPEGVEILAEDAFVNCTSEEIKIPASVIEIEGWAFPMNRKIKDITVSDENEVYGKDGQCIYNKKDKSLSVAIAYDNEIKISNKVEVLTTEYSMVNCNTSHKNLKKVIFPKFLKSVTVPAFSRLSDASKVYFTGETVPEIKNYSKDWASLPIFTKVYVPKQQYDIYEQWYEEYESLDCVYEFGTYDEDDL